MGLKKVFLFTRTMMVSDKGEVVTYSCDEEQLIMSVWRDIYKAQEAELDICVRPKETKGNDGQEDRSTLFTATVGNTLSHKDLETILREHPEADAVDMEAALLWKETKRYNFGRDKKVKILPILKAVSDSGDKNERDEEPGDAAKYNVALVTK